MSIEYWVTCAHDPWSELESDEAFGDIVAALRDDGEYAYEAVTLELEESPPSFVPVGSVVVHVVGSPGANWDEVMEFLDAMAAAGDGAVFTEDRQIVLDRRSTRPGVKAFKEEPTWATALARKMPGLHVIVTGPQAVADPVAELAKVGLAAMSRRVTITTVDGGLEIRGERATDALVAGQALSYAVRGRAVARGPGGDIEELPR